MSIPFHTESINSHFKRVLVALRYFNIRTARLSSWHNKRIREMCRVTMRQTYIHRISSKCLQQRTGVFELEH